MTYDSAGDLIVAMDAQEDFVRNEIATAATVVIRTNQLAEIDGKAIYADVRVRKALQLAIDNAKLLELGYSNQGLVAENHHVGPMHPEYSPMDPPAYDPAAAIALLQDAGLADFEHELVCDDEQWRADTADVAAAQLRDAGIKVRRVNYPGSTFYNDWNKYPFSTTNWNHRPLAVQMFAIAYRSGAAWNEFGFANTEFDKLLDQALATADTTKRAEIVAKMQRILRDEGVTVQPFWRSLINHTRKGLGGGGRHIAAQMFPERLYWAA
jgi:peptide/nickel transport system substrate-binding protein